MPSLCGSAEAKHARSVLIQRLMAKGLIERIANPAWVPRGLPGGVGNPQQMMADPDVESDHARGSNCGIARHSVREVGPREIEAVISAVDTVNGCSRPSRTWICSR
jgi:hypothetical protein